jgi:hypothetical protein
MRSLNVSYQLSQNVAKKLGISSAKIIGVGLNPITFFNPYDYKAASGAYNVYPQMRTWSLGLNLTL